MLISYAPGKIILSGEHAVVYDRPALVTAVARAANCRGQIAEKEYAITAADYNNRQWKGSAEQLFETAGQLEQRYQRFLDGHLTIDKVLRQPEELALYALAQILDRARNALPGGLKLNITSDIPAGCGMGSSAAVALAVLEDINALLELHLDKPALFKLALAVEHMQHGKPSGADPYVCLHGGLVRFTSGEPHRVNTELPRLRLVHTGTPQSSTGECVAQVARDFGPRGPWDAIEETTRTIEKGLRAGNPGVVKDGVRQNQQLLTRIGVTPARLQRFVRDVEEAGGAAKICGAGSIRGDAAGIVWIVGIDNPDYLCNRYGYTLLEVDPVQQGAGVLTEIP